MTVVTVGAIGTSCSTVGTQRPQCQRYRFTATIRVGTILGTESSGDHSSLGMLFALKATVTVTYCTGLAAKAKTFFGHVFVRAIGAFHTGEEGAPGGGGGWLLFVQYRRGHWWAEYCIVAKLGPKLPRLLIGDFGTWYKAKTG